MKVQDNIRTIFDSLVPAQVAYALVPIAPGSMSPYAEERMAVKNAGRKRQLEFFAGRKAARQALGRLGVRPLVIPIGLQRAPVWPSGIVGAITHTQYHAAAVAASAKHFSGIGLDLEENGRINEALATEIEEPGSYLSSTYIDILASQGICANTLHYSAKEAGFKAYFPATKHFMTYQDASCSIDLTTNSFTLSVNDQLRSLIFSNKTLQGRFICTGSYLVTFSWC